MTAEAQRILTQLAEPADRFDVGAPAMEVVNLRAVTRPMPVEGMGRVRTAGRQSPTARATR